MATAATWLTELGTPPCEICLDWSWQLREHSLQASNAASRQGTRPLEWENIEVTETGVLKVESDYHLHYVDHLLAQLEDWSSATNYVNILGDKSVIGTHATVTELAESQSLQPAKPLRLAKQKRASASPVASILSYIKSHRTIAVVSCLLATAGAGWFLLSANMSEPYPHEAHFSAIPKRTSSCDRANHVILCAGSCFSRRLIGS